MPEGLATVVSAEHAGLSVPAPWSTLFRGAEPLLRSHRGWDPGSLELARELARRTRAPLVATTVTRLLIDCNRSEDSSQLFSEFTRGLPEDERESLRLEWHAPHRARVEEAVRAALEGARRVVHVGAHSFTPTWKGRTREVDVGLLHDPRREREAVLVRAWRGELLRRRPDLRVRLNRPYRGWTDGLPTTLRARFPPSRYLGLELEVNQAITTGAARAWRELREALALSFRSALARA